MSGSTRREDISRHTDGSVCERGRGVVHNAALRAYGRSDRLAMAMYDGIRSPAAHVDTTALRAHISRVPIEWARPLKFLLDQHVRDDLTPSEFAAALPRLPPEAIRGIGPVRSTALRAQGLHTIAQLAQAPLGQYEAAGISKWLGARYRSFAGDIIRHCIYPAPNIGPLRLAELLDAAHEKTPVANLPDLPIDAIEGISQQDRTALRNAGWDGVVGELAHTENRNLVFGTLGNRRGQWLLEAVDMLHEHHRFAELEATLPKLRTLIFAGVLELKQVVSHEGIDFPLDNPNVGQAPGQQNYDGYLIVADTMGVHSDIATRGYDLTLVAMALQAGSCCIDLSPPPFDSPAPQESPGSDGKDGGRMTVVCRELDTAADFSIRVRGSDGQNGGAGRDMVTPEILELPALKKTPGANLPAGATRRVGVCWGTLGTIVEVKENPNMVERYGGRWSILGEIPDGVIHTEFNEVTIPAHVYPTDGRSGGYGGSAGSIAVVVPPHVAATVKLLAPGDAPPPNPSTWTCITCDISVGNNGQPGLGGRGGDLLPTYVRYMFGNQEMTRRPLELIREKTISDDYTTRVEGWSLLSDLQVQRVPATSDASGLSLRWLEFNGSMHLAYRRKPDAFGCHHAYPGPIDLRRANAGYIELIGGTSHGVLHQETMVNESYEEPTSPSLGISLCNAEPGETLVARPEPHGPPELIGRNWFEAVWQTVPDYPWQLFVRADRHFRRGEGREAMRLYRGSRAAGHKSRGKERCFISIA